MSDTSLKIRSRLSQMSGAEKSAIILMALGENMGPVWEKLGEDEIREVSHAMSGLGVVEAELVEALIGDFVSKMSGQGMLMGTYEQTQKLLLNFLPQEKANDLQLDFFNNKSLDCSYQDSIEQKIQEFIQSIPRFILEFMSDSNLCITRAGASTLSELTFLNVPNL